MYRINHLMNRNKIFYDGDYKGVAYKGYYVSFKLRYG